MRFLAFLLFITFLVFEPSWAVKPRKVVKKIKIEDKIFLITHPLMKEAKRVKDTVFFTWSEPHHDFTYFLQIFREGNLVKPISSINVTGGIKKIRFSKKEKKKLYWRILAQSRYGNRTNNKKLKLVPLVYEL